jgi:hypothetical protein
VNKVALQLDAKVVSAGSALCSLNSSTEGCLHYPSYLDVDRGTPTPH